MSTTLKDAQHQLHQVLGILTGHVKPKFILMGLVKEPSGKLSGTWNELDPNTGVAVPPYVQGGSGDALGW